MAKTLLLLIIAFVTLDFVISSVLSWLNTKWMTHPVPPELEGLYDDEKYRKQQDYMRTNKRVSLIARCVSFALTLVILGFGLLGWLDNQCKAWTDVPMLQVILFLVIYNLFNTVIALPFSYYSTFVIEERFGFNRTTHKTFWLDAVKSFAVSTLLSAVLLGVVYWLYQTFGQQFWIWATLVCAAFIIFFSMFYSNLIVPLFNKQTPLPEGELRDAITAAVASFGSRFKDIYIIDGSKHSTKANAYFTGFGPKKRIVLYDTLQDQMTNDEIVAVLAHEFGHYKHRDTFKNMFISIVMVAVNLFIFSLLVSNPDLPAAWAAPPRRSSWRSWPSRCCSHPSTCCSTLPATPFRDVPNTAPTPMLPSTATAKPSSAASRNWPATALATSHPTRWWCGSATATPPWRNASAPSAQQPKRQPG